MQNYNNLFVRPCPKDKGLIQRRVEYLFNKYLFSTLLWFFLSSLSTRSRQAGSAGLTTKYFFQAGISIVYPFDREVKKVLSESWQTVSPRGITLLLIGALRYWYQKGGI